MTKNWCVDFFDEDFADLYLERGADSVGPAVRFLSEKLRLTPGARVFDQCCGVGTIALALASAGFSVTGVDLVPSYVSRAQAAAAGLDCRIHAGDARDFVTAEPCDAAFNWWTSFGYYEDDAQNLKMLASACNSLKTGGRFVLDYMNREERLAAFAKNDNIVSRTPHGHWETFYDRKRDMLVKNWLYRDTGGKIIEKNGGGTKLYGASEIAWLLEAAGFGNIVFYGDYAGAPLLPSSPRCIAVAERTSRPELPR